MPSYCTINEIEIEVVPASRETAIVGSRKRAFDGSWRQNIRASKDAWSTQTTLMVRDDADALYALLMGFGHNFRFAAASDYYSGKGLAGTPTATATAGGASGKFDKRLTLDATGKVVWTPTGDDALTGDYTLTVWHLASTGPDVWEHWAVRSLGGAVTYWVDGVNQGGAASVSWEAKLSVTAGVLQLGDAANADVFSDLVAVPFAMPDAWITSLAAATRQFPDRPNVEVAGDMVNRALASSLSCCAIVEGFTPIPFVSSAGEQLDGGRVAFRLEVV